MNKFYSKSVALCLCAIAAGNAYAYDFTADGIYYSKISDKTVAVVYQNDNYNSYSGDVAVPATVENEGVTYAVTAVAESAFRASSRMTSVTLPEGIVTIGDYAFYNCSKLTEITIPKSVTYIGDGAFQSCGNIEKTITPDVAAWCGITFASSNSNPAYQSESLYVGTDKITDLVIPEGVKTIGAFAFYYNKGITSVKIPASVDSIGNNAFYQASKLVKVEISDLAAWCGIKFYNSNSNPLYNAHNLYEGGQLIENMVIPSGVKTIGSYAFQSCTGMTKVTLPASLTQINSAAFSSCSKLTGVYVDNLDTWYGISFGGDTANPLYYAKNLYVNNELVSDIVFPAGTTEVPAYAFYGANITKVTFPDGLVKIGEYAFNSCAQLVSVKLPATVTTIGKNVFAKTVLTSIELPEAMTVLETSVFQDCKSLAAVKFPTKLESIGNSCFSGCLALTSVELPTSLATLGNNAFEKTGITQIKLPAAVKQLGSSVFANCASLNSITLPEGLTTIGQRALQGCTSLAAVEFPASLTAINSSAFNNCSALTSVKVPDTVTDLGEGIFSGCSALTDVTLPASLKVLPNNTFYGCSSLTTVKLPGSVQSVGNYAFYNSGLKTFVAHEGIETMGDYVFDNCLKLESVTISGSVTKIGNYAFRKCSALNEVIVASGNTKLTIGYISTYPKTPAFAQSPVATLSLGREVVCSNTAADYIPFKGNTDLKTLTIGDGVASVTSTLDFSQYAALETMNLGSALTEVPDMTACTALRSITLSATVPQKATGFAQTTYDTCQLNVPVGTKDAYKAADVWGKFVNITDGQTTSIDGIEVGDMLATPEYFNLQGVRVVNPTPGIYVVKRGNRITKEVVM